MARSHVRETPFEDNLVHGVHAVIALLEAACRDFGLHGTVGRLQAVFAKPVFPGEPLRPILIRSSATDMRLALVHEEEALVRLSVKLAPTSWKGPSPDFRGLLPEAKPDEPDLMKERLSLTPLPLAPSLGEIGARYPLAAGLFAPGGLPSLALLSTAVGMRWPGAASLFAGFTAHFPGTADATDRLELSAEPLDPRVGITRLAVANAFVSAEVEAFRLPSPPVPPDLAALRPAVSPGAFAGQRALVVGATDGLGATTARLLALGGADLVISYYSKSAAAASLRDEIRAMGGECCLIRLDVGDPADLDRIDWTGFNCVYLFASPRIFLRKTRFWNQERFAAFAAAYLEPLANIAGRLHQKGSKGRKCIFYPSTVAIDEASSEISEYAAAKLAGEHLAATVPARYPDLLVEVARLPRLETWQTTHVIHVEAADTVSTLLPILERIAAAIRAEYPRSP